MRVAAIDLGSNSVKLSIGDVEGAQVRVIESDRVLLQLGRLVAATGLIGPEAIEAAAATVAAMATRARLAGCRRIDVVGTSAAREAADGATLQAAVSAAGGVPMRVLSGLDEAHLVSRSVEVAHGMPLGTAVLFDVGGASTEIVRIDAGLVVDQCSLPLGAARLAQQHGLTSASPPGSDVLAALDESIAAELDALEPAGVTQAVGCGGTVTALALLNHQGFDASGCASEALSSIDGVTLELEAIVELTDRLSSVSLRERMQLTGLEEGRAAILPTGGRLLWRLMERLGVSSAVVHEQGIRTGLLADLAAR
ncbi:MAG: hypothetical protein MK101_02570 [Phycisphaerales bacterium]|nr:hypothetical protein [Phycisphaerales bacterium]